MGTLHARNVQGLSAAQLVAVASTRPARAAEAAAELGVRASTYEELFAADDVDAVVLAARSIDHASRASEVLAAGKHLFLEKPGATTVAGQAAVRASAKAHPDRVVQVGYHRRYDPRTWLATARRGWTIPIPTPVVSADRSNSPATAVVSRKPSSSSLRRVASP